VGASISLINFSFLNTDTFLNYDDQNSTSKTFNILLDRFKSTNIKLSVKYRLVKKKCKLIKKRNLTLDQRITK
jgi:hypothetical protein